MDSPARGPYPAPVIPRVLFAALCLAPALARAETTTAPTTGESDSDDAAGTGTGTGATTATMPPEYEPCGCRSDQLGGGASLALAGLALLALRRRKP